MTIDLTKLITAVIEIVFTLIVGLLTTKIIPMLREKGLYKYADVFVKCALTAFEAGHGKEKFDYVFERISESKYGKYFDAETIKAAIQAAYVNMCNELKKEPSPMTPNDDEGKEQEK